MPNKRVILAIVAVALVFGVVVSGCNRNRDTRMTQAGTRRQAKEPKNRKENRRERERGRELAQAPAVRPAEVLASSVRRPQQRRRSGAPMARPVNMPAQSVYQQNYQPLPVVVATSYELARVHEPLPEPVPVSQLYPQTTYSQPYYQAQTYSAPSYDVYGATGVYSDPAPVYSEPIQIIHPSPELAMARASLEPVPMAAPAYVPQNQPANIVPPIEPQMFRAPIPELEPVRYQRVAAKQSRQVPVLMSGPVPAWSSPAQPEVRRVTYETLPQPASAPTQGWVPSPTTAMGSVRGGY